MCFRATRDNQQTGFKIQIQHSRGEKNSQSNNKGKSKDSNGPERNQSKPNENLEGLRKVLH